MAKEVLLPEPHPAKEGLKLVSLATDNPYVDKLPEPHPAKEGLKLGIKKTSSDN